MRRAPTVVRYSHNFDSKEWNVFKNLIIVLGLVFAVNAMAAEASWKSTLRSFLGAEWGNKLLGPAPIEEIVSQITLPDIPKLVKKNTDIGTYTKKVKEPTEFDRLPNDKKRHFDSLFVQELFVVTRKTQAKDEDLSNWLNTLEQGGSREGIYQALVLDEVYSALENLSEKPADGLLKFCLSFSQKFYNQTFTTESLKGLNLFSLKRIIAEKGLDLLEYYETQDLDLMYRWYAVFSADLSAQYPDVFKDQVRKNTSDEFHYQWAKSTPIQHIKSEFVIKLHSVMNSLQQL